MVLAKAPIKNPVKDEAQLKGLEEKIKQLALCNLAVLAVITLQGLICPICLVLLSGYESMRLLTAF